MNFKDMSHEELIQYCKDNTIDYLTKQKKLKAHATLLKELSKLSINDKPVIETNNLELIIKQCHNYLYKSSGIVGSKAQNDIMRILIIRIFNILLSNKNVYIEKLVNDYKETNSILKDFKNTYNEDINNIKEEEEKEIIQKHLNYIDYLYDINKILEYKGNAIEDEWKEFIIYCVSDILKNIYSKDDYRFNTPNSYDINELIKIISKINISDDFINNFAEHNGDIHEYFLKYQGNVNSKELGQFFTPRVIIERTLNDCGLKDIILSLDNLNLDICDPCMGTGGLLSYTYKYCKDKIKPSNIYGCDIEKDTIKFGVASLMLTTNEYNKNIIRCNSLIENPYLFENKKFNIVFTNPPFGTKNNYKDLKENFESYKKLNYKDSSLKFEDIYPINTNKGTNLFIQLVVYLLKENGICAIVLPDGELMTSNNTSNIEIRKFILDKCKILKIINIEGGVFINTNIKTKVLIFQKGNYDNYNQEIEFLDIINGGKEIKLITKQKLNETYQFNIKKQEEIKNYNNDFELIEFGKIFELIKGTIQSSKVVEDENGESVFINLSKNKDFKKINSYSLNNQNIFISNVSPLGLIQYYNGKCEYSNLLYHIKIKDNFIDKINIKYIYYYLLNKKEFIEENYQKGCANKSLDVENFNLMKIPIPSLEQQKEIVEYLDIIDKNINSSNQKIEEIKNFNENYLNLNLKYNQKIEIKTLDEICIINPENMKLGEYTEINYIDIASVKGGKILEIQNLTEFPSRAKRIIKQYDILYSSVRPNLKGYVYINDIIQNGIASTGFALIRVNNNIILSKYLYYILTKENITNELISKASGALYPSVSFDDFKTIKISIPSLEKQKEIIEYLDFNNNLIDNLNKEIENNKNQAKIFFNMFFSD